MEDRTIEQRQIEVGQRLVEIRGDEGQRSFADGLDIAGNTLGRYERGERLPESDVLLKLADRGIDINWLLGGGQKRSETRPFTFNLNTDGLAGEFVLVPHYDVKFEGGDGNEPFDDANLLSSPIAFRRDWLEDEGIFGEPLSAFDSDGDSMAPTIPRGYIILVNRRFKAFSGPGIYALLAFGRYVLKRLDINPVTGDLHLISDNKEKYGERIVPSDLQDQLHFIGRAIWWAPGHVDR